jgi:hypothetical protein
MLKKIALVLAALLCMPVAGLEAGVGLNKARPFLKKHCYECHGPKKQKGDLRYDTLGVDLSKTESMETWQEILDQLNLGEMPPKKQPKPLATESRPIVDLLTAELKLAYAQRRSTGGQTVMRRLNKYELRNTLRDLLYIQHPDFHPHVVSGLYDFNGNGRTAQKTIEPTRDFPDDESAEGLDNIGQKLVMSDFLFKMMLEASEVSLDMASEVGDRKKLKPKTYSSPIVSKPNRLGGGSLDRWHRDLKTGYDGVFQRYQRYGRVGPDELERGMGVSARYRITVELSAHNQKHPWGKLLVTKQDEPFSIGLFLERKEHLRGARVERQVQWKVPGDGKKHTFTCEAWIDKTWTPWVGWENGPSVKHNVHGNLVKEFYPKLYHKQSKEKGARDKWSKEMANVLFQTGGSYKGPHLRIYSMKIEPVLDQWPPKSFAALYGTGPIEKANVSALMQQFATRAFRRPVASSEVAKYVALVQRMKADGAKTQDAMKTGYAAILCSPDFMYLKEKPGTLDHYAIAARLSYFLWASMPDDELIALAKAKKLRGAVLDAQVERMLRDPKVAAFTRHFPERWLHLHELGRMPPAQKGPYGEYYKQGIKDGMVPQVEAYFEDLLVRNGPIRDLIDSDYTFLNEGFARVYHKRDDIRGPYFQKVKMEDRKFTGLFMLPAVMTVTANGVDTSPIVRGVYVLENILGTPPSPPPPDVEPLPTDTSAAKTLKQQMELHRKQESCNACHRKIDPMGFALESFDPIGRWRDNYLKTDPKRPDRMIKGDKIDTSGTLATGKKMAGLVEYKQMLLGRETLVTRCLTKKLLSYASGRLMESADRGEIDRIVGQLKAKKGGLRDLVKLVVQSKVFLSK